MKPDSYMPFDGNKFFEAVAGFPDDTSMAYLKLCWHYWHHLHARGLPDDAEYLRRAAQVDRGDWNRVRDSLFDNDKYFTQDADGLWHQKFTEELWKDAEAAYRLAVKRGRAGADARWNRKRGRK